MEVTKQRKLAICMSLLCTLILASLFTVLHPIALAVHSRNTRQDVVWSSFTDMNALPEEAQPVPWTKSSGAGATSSVRKGILTIDTTSATYYLDTILNYHHPDSDWTSNVNNLMGWIVEARLQVDSATEDDAFIQIWTHDRTWLEVLYIYKDRLTFYPATSNDPDYPPVNLDTTSAFHTYTITGQGESYKVYIDGMLSIDYAINWGGGSFGINFGDGDTQGRTKSYWDYFAYKTTPIPPPPPGVPEFPLGSAMPLVLTILLAYLWWRRKQNAPQPVSFLMQRNTETSVLCG